MPRLDQDDKPDETKNKKKRRKLKFKKQNKVNQELGEIFKDQPNKKEKSLKPKKSYHAYLEHPRLKHQSLASSPISKNIDTDLNPLGIAPRPKKK